jgi:hypothetical protein
MIRGSRVASSHAALASSSYLEAEPTYTYQVYVRPYPGWWRRWHGRVITRDPEGQHRFWPWRFARDREELVRSLWEEVHRDIEWRRGGVAVELLEVTSTLR